MKVDRKGGPVLMTGPPFFVVEFSSIIVLNGDKSYFFLFAQKNQKTSEGGCRE